MSIKLVSLNIEGQKHLAGVRDFLAREKADVVCLMEVYQSDVEDLAGSRYRDWVYGPNNIVRRQTATEKGETLGVVVMSREPLKGREVKYFDGKTLETLAVVGRGTHSPVMVMVELGGYRLGAVHLTWTPSGKVTGKQRTHLDNLLRELSGRELLMCGDFNIPRGNEMYLKLADRWRDNIPPEIDTTLDPVLHYANKEQKGRLKLVVDYVWDTSKYRVSEVRVVEGVSDHCAVICEVDQVI